MIQRIQTFFLLMVAGLMTAANFFPLWAQQAASGEKQELFLSSHVHTLTEGGIVKDTFPFTILAVVSGVVIVLCLWEIVSFKNRVKQMLLGMINSLLMLASVGGTFYFVFQNQARWQLTQGNGYALGFYLILAAVVCNQIALRYIKKDEDLVRSVDRIR